MASLLLIDDDSALLDVTSLAFSDEGHDVRTALNGAEGRQLHAAAPADVIVSDVNMPVLDGFSLCRKIREAGDRTPIILLTSRADEIDEALGLELGADDYVTKPFSMRILLARVQSLLRREEFIRQATTSTFSTTRGNLTLDADRLQVCWKGQALVVTVSEFRLVEALTARPGIVLTRDQLLDRVRGDDSVVAQRIIDTYVRRLRRKFEFIDAEFNAIETVVGAGYRWSDR